MVPSSHEVMSGGDEQNACLLLNSIKLAARRFAFVAKWRKNLAPRALNFEPSRSDIEP